MRVYGDRYETGDPDERLADLGLLLDRCADAPPGIDRHVLLVEALIEGGQLLQGLADTDYCAAGEDRTSVPTRELGEFLHLLASAVCRSWDSGFAEVGELPLVPRIDQLPASIELRMPEGFAFYAVYPEAYIEAARRLSLAAPARVIGIRSIGTTLAATVAAALDAAPAITVRPHGDAFARQIAISSELESELLASDAHFVIVDEGPGLSGSSFGAVADWLQGRGVPLNRIAFLPSHDDEPGPRASEAHREQWMHVQRVAAQFTKLPQLLGEYASVLLGGIGRELIDISAGEWRKLSYSRQEDWPAVNPAWERCKFVGRAGGKRYLLKFAGLGRIGRDKLQMARALHSAGFVPEPLGLVHGFLIERWHEDAEPLDHGSKPVEQIAHYVGGRAKLFPAAPTAGATLSDLLEMCRRNISLVFGERFPRTLDAWQSRLDPLSRKMIRVRSDNCLLPHEWLRLPAGLLKADSVDHHAGHDLIGCQDMAWDVAGAIVEFELDAAESKRLIAVAEDAGGRHLDPELLDFYLIAYLAFRVGQITVSLEASTAEDLVRLRRDQSRYRGQLQQLLHESSEHASRHGSLVG